MARRTHHIRLVHNSKAVSIVVTTLIISAAILIATAMASFLGMNVLELQSQQAEFDQGKQNMRTLSEIIEDVGVKPGSGSFIRFNERTGGLGYVVDSRPLTLTVTNGTSSSDLAKTLSNTPLNITYRAGRLVGTYNDTIKGTNSLLTSGLANPLGLLRQQQADGAWLILDYNRVRIVNGSVLNVGSDRYDLVTVTFFNMTYGTFTGSGSIDVKVQNTRTNLDLTSSIYNGGTVTITVSYGGVSSQFQPQRNPGTRGVIVMVAVSNIELSTL